MMGITEEQERLLRGPRRDLDRARRDPATWHDLAFRAEHADDNRVIDRNSATRFGVLWALQYDRRSQDLPLLRFLLQEQATFYREAVSMGLAPDLTLAGFLVAEHRQVEDLWLHWTAKNISFDTALGYHLYHLLTGGIAATVEVVRASAHPERDRILKEITSSRHTDAAVEEWLEEQRRILPPDPAEESLKTWAYHAACLGEREASRLFMTEWAAGEPRTNDTLNTLQFHLAHLGYLTEAVAVQKEAVAICDDSPGSSRMASALLGLVRLQRQAGQFTDARQSLQAAGRSLAALPDWPWMGMWVSFVKEHFLLVPVTSDKDAGRRLLDEADHYLRDAPENWLRGVLDQAIAAAEHLNEDDRRDRYRAMRGLDRHEREDPRSPGSAGTA
ncbi:hypothetical protein AB0D09_28380 [Streptomyces sp. NPDC049097]|uniref:hypothetical protein n=1 Tax=Streptomyces sp. NPDC049097 TaxID=3155497 RepID=UPI00343AF774